MSQDPAWNVFPSAKSRSAAARDASNPNVLKRYQACHQCRKRKLKCDAKRPCSTCVRSHAHAITHAPKGSQMPAHPECTFDGPAEVDSISSGSSIPPGSETNSATGLEDNTLGLEGLSVAHNKENDMPSHNHQLSYDRQSSSELDRDIYIPLPPSSGTPHFSSAPDLMQTATASSTREPALDLFVESIDPGESLALLSPHLEMIRPNWPPGLPVPQLLRHLIEIFFTSQPHARRLFHVPSFMNSLTYPPSHPQFPISPVLHAICAISPMYTAAALMTSSLAGGVFYRGASRGYTIIEQNPESFTEQQALLAKETIAKCWATGHRPLQVLQANIVLSWYLWNHAKLFDAWDCTGRSLRMVSLLKLNSCPPFESMAAQDLIATLLLPPAESWIEEEMRRNVFWLAYSLDRTFAIGSTFAIDHNDVGQIFPIRGDLFDNGDAFLVDQRQWAHTEDVLLVHPEDQCDSFTIFIKGTMLITHVKNFTHRFKIHHYASNFGSISSEAPDPRRTQEFQDLDNTLSSFRKSFPPSLRNPINGGVVDRHLYAACLCMPTAIIIFHEPYADARNSGCISSIKVLTAARDILDLIYIIWSTSYDITLLDLSCTLGWYLAGRVFARCLQVAIEANSQDQISILRTELAFIQLAIRKVGERIPLAREHAKILHLLAIKLCGASYAGPLNASLGA